MTLDVYRERKTTTQQQHQQSTHVSAMPNFKSARTPMHVLKKTEKGNIMKPLDSISELISSFDLPEILKYV